MSRRPVPLAAEITPSTIHTLRREPNGEAGSALSTDERTALLADVRGNPGSTARLLIDAVTYHQSEAPNANHVRFRDGALRAVARSFVGAPFLRDHNQRDMLARGGTIVASELRREEDTGLASFHQTIELTKPWAIEAALDGTLDRFSIGWKADGPISCTVCHQEFVRSAWGTFPSCDHELGQSYEVRGEQRIAQAEFSGAIGVECSGVSVPAVADTGIESIRVALAGIDPAELEALMRGPGHFLPQQEFTPMKTIAQALGLAATADEAMVLAELEKRSTLLDAERRGRVEAEARLMAAQEAAMEQRRKEVAARALREGKIRPGSDLATKIDQLALVSIDAAEALVNELPRVTLVGAPMLSQQLPDKVPPRDPQITDEEAEVMRQLNAAGANLTAADFARARAAGGAPLPAALKEV